MRLEIEKIEKLYVCEKCNMVMQPQGLQDDKLVIICPKCKKQEFVQNT